jgi:hypothetical protein
MKHVWQGLPRRSVQTRHSPFRAKCNNGDRRECRSFAERLPIQELGISDQPIVSKSLSKAVCA